MNYKTRSHQPWASPKTVKTSSISKLERHNFTRAQRAAEGNPLGVWKHLRNQEEKDTGDGRKTVWVQHYDRCAHICSLCTHKFHTLFHIESGIFMCAKCKKLFFPLCVSSPSSFDMWCHEEDLDNDAATLLTQCSVCDLAGPKLDRDAVS